MRKLIAAVVAVLASVALANTYVPVEFIQTDGYAYLDTGVPGNAKKVQQKARLQFLAVPPSTTMVAVFGSYSGGLTSYSSCALTVASDHVYPNYTGSTSSGYYYGAPTANGFHDYYLHHGYSQDYGGGVGRSDTTGVGYNWGSLKDQELPTLLLGNIKKDDGELHTAVGSVVPIRWYSYEAIDHETGASLCRFTPAKCVETGLFGMLDAVSGKFITSEVEGHPILGPDYVEWAGTGADYASNAIILVPANTTNVVNHTAVAKLNPTGGIKVEDETSVFSFSNCTGSASLYAPFWGPGEVRVEQGSGTMKFHADNRAFAGQFSLIELQADLYHRYGWGLTNRVFLQTGKYCDLHTSGTVSNTYVFAKMSNRFCQQGSEAFTLAGPTYLDLVGGLNLHGANGGIHFSGSVTNISTNTTFQSSIISSRVYFEGDHDRYMGRLYIKSQGTVYLGGKMHFVSRGYGIWQNPQDYGQVGATDGSTVRFLSPYVLDEDINFLMGWSYTANTTPKGYIYLDGNDQQVGRLITGLNGVKSDSRPQATSLKLDSPTNAPAKLVIRNTAVCGHSPNCSNLPGCWPGIVTGAASVEINTATNIETAGLIAFTCAGSDTTGGLYARRGTIKIYETASFTNLTELVASGEGQIEVLTSAIGGGAGGEALGGLCVALTNVAAGTIPLTIGEGCSITARTAVTRSAENPKWLEPGVYTKDNLPLCLAGDGELVVKEYGGPKGLMLIIR